MLTKEELLKGLSVFSIESDSILLVHSSLKALGYIDGGAETVISVLKEIVSNGTLVMPTLSQKNWDTVFEDWHMDRPSDTGYITEVFRTQRGSYRSNNPTHSVVAQGVLAEDLTGGAPNKGERYGIFGDFCFSHESAWQRMYDSRTRYGVKAYVLFWGVSMKYSTFKHFSEYRLVEETLLKIKDEQKRAEMKNKLSHYPFPPKADFVWPFYSSFLFQDTLEQMGIAKKMAVGEGEIICCDIFDCVNATDRALRSDLKNMIKPTAYAWFEEAQKYF